MRDVISNLLKAPTSERVSAIPVWPAAEGAAAEAVAYPEQVAGTVTELYGVVPRASRVRRNNNSLLLQVYGKPEIIC